MSYERLEPRSVRYRLSAAIRSGRFTIRKHESVTVTVPVGVLPGTSTDRKDDAVESEVDAYVGRQVRTA